jgi:restriction endonuclease Mrr
MAKRASAELISTLASVGDKKYTDLMLALGLIKINKRGSYEITDSGQVFLKEYDEARMKSLQDFFGKSLKESRRKTRVVAHVKTSAKIGNIIDLADRVIRESRAIERTLRKKRPVRRE